MNLFINAYFTIHIMTINNTLFNNIWPYDGWLLSIFCSGSCKSNEVHDSCLLTLTYRYCFYSHRLVLAWFVGRLLHRFGCLVLPLPRRLLHRCGLWLSPPSSFLLPVDCCIAVHSLHSRFSHWVMISCNKCRSISLMRHKRVTSRRLIVTCFFAIRRAEIDTAPWIPCLPTPDTAQIGDASNWDEGYGVD